MISLYIFGLSRTKIFLNGGFSLANAIENKNKVKIIFEPGRSIIEILIALIR